MCLVTTLRQQDRRIGSWGPGERDRQVNEMRLRTTVFTLTASNLAGERAIGAAPVGPGTIAPGQHAGRLEQSERPADEARECHAGGTIRLFNRWSKNLTMTS